MRMRRFRRNGRDHMKKNDDFTKYDRGPADRRAWRMFRELYDRYPKETGFLVRNIQLAGNHWLDLFPPIEKVNGRPIEVSVETLAMLLADYRNAQARNIRQQEFLVTLAAKHCRFGNHYFESMWCNADTIATHLKAARKRAKSDPQFEAEVRFYERALAESKLSSAGWGEKVGSA
jgi:hypothetical protein